MGIDEAVSTDRPRNGRIHVLICEEQPLVRVGLRTLLNAEPDIEVVGDAKDGQEAIASARRLLPDIVLMGVPLPRLCSIAATRQVATASPSVSRPPEVLMLSASVEVDLLLSAVRAGARGFILKDAPAAEVVQGIRTVAAGAALLSPFATRALLDWLAGEPPRTAEPPPPAFDRLTPREKTVVELLGEGRSTEMIARALYVSEATVRSYVHRILFKLQLRDRLQLVAFAHKYGIVDVANIKDFER